ncbi:MAG: DUF4129 domain-containing protein [Gemmatimonadetes bacterium]|nr:DUF4129 domain-containing protein [Gemmatimonadota bacterium]
MSRPGSDMALRRFGTAAGVVVACGVVALASPGLGILVEPAAEGAPWLGVARAGGIAAVLIGAAMLLPPPAARGGAFMTRPDPRSTALSAAVTLMVLVSLLALFAPPILVDEQPGVGVPDPNRPGRVSEDATGTPPPSVPPGGESPTAGFEMEDVLPPPPLPDRPEAPRTAETAPPATPVDWSLLRNLANLALIVLAAGLALLGRRAWRARLGRGPDDRVSPEDEAAREAAGVGLRASIAEMTRPGNSPREQITAAYRRLLDALAEAGVPRLPQEAPHEHLSRTLGALGVRPASMHELTRVYVSAQFGDSLLTEAHKQTAERALRDSLHQLSTRTGTDRALSRSAS